MEPTLWLEGVWIIEVFGVEVERDVADSNFGLKDTNEWLASYDTENITFTYPWRKNVVSNH